jgi:hypothetical protein
MIEGLLPPAVRSRQLTPPTLLTGMMLALADSRPAHLTRAHAALLALPEADQKRLGVIEDWKNGPHQLTYRQLAASVREVRGYQRPGPSRSNGGMPRLTVRSRQRGRTVS